MPGNFEVKIKEILDELIAEEKFQNKSRDWYQSLPVQALELRQGAGQEAERVAHMAQLGTHV